MVGEPSPRGKPATWQRRGGPAAWPSLRRRRASRMARAAGPSEQRELRPRLGRPPEGIGAERWQRAIEAGLPDRRTEERGDLIGVRALPALANAPPAVVRVTAA